MEILNAQAEFSNQEFKGLIYKNGSVSLKEFNSCLFVRCSFLETVFKECHFYNCTFRRCDLSLVHFKDCSFSETRFEDFAGHRCRLDRDNLGQLQIFFGEAG